MRRWLLLGIVAVVLGIVAKLNTRERRRRVPLLRRINFLLNVAFWAILIGWAATLVWWLVARQGR